MTCCVYHHRKHKLEEAKRNIDKRNEFPSFNNVIAFNLDNSGLNINASTLPIKASNKDEYYVTISFNDPEFDTEELKIIFIAHNKIYIHPYKDHIVIPLEFTSKSGELVIALYRFNRAMYSGSGNVYQKSVNDDLHWFISNEEETLSDLHAYFVPEDTYDFLEYANHILLADYENEELKELSVSANSKMNIVLTDRYKPLLESVNIFDTSDILFANPIIVS